MNPALLIVDVQKGFDQEEHWGGNRNNRDAEDKIAQILAYWRTKKIPCLSHITQLFRARFGTSHFKTRL